MDGFLKIILTLGVSSVVTAAYLPTIPETNQNISALAITCTDYYNKGSSEDSIFQLDGTEHGTLIDKDPTFQQLTFIIKETRCKKSEENINKPCAFKEDGVVKQCTASIFPGDGERKMIVTCDTLYQNNKKKRDTSNPPCDCRCCYLKNNKCRRRPGCGGSIESLDINI
ncbi:cathelicidin-related peptide Oh-Cath-like [Pelobates fuscus]|uniref:cathelicidin-related peptide Oh-Cath-like n=1 Tax=Pelobates fuscus TaxID=191477 RepID=UPI002FE4AB0A